MSTWVADMGIPADDFFGYDDWKTTNPADKDLGRGRPAARCVCGHYRYLCDCGCPAYRPATQQESRLAGWKE